MHRRKTADEGTRETVIAAAAGYFLTPCDHPDDRPSVVRVSDRGDVLAATKSINGGADGLADRQARYTRAKSIGNAVRPDPAAARRPPAEEIA